MEPEETVTALKIREGTVGILYEERREGEKAWSSRGVWRKEKRRGESLESGEGRTGLRWGKANPNQWDVRTEPLGGTSGLETPCRQAASTRGS